MKDKRINTHFSLKKKHTSIKHSIFKVALTSSVSIANMKLTQMKWTSPRYLYIDLFAGSGKFEDGSKGSVLIAIDVFKKHITAKKGEKVKNRFEEFYVIAIEKDKETYKKLEGNIKNIDTSEIIKVGTGSGDWTNYDKDLKNFIQLTDWGFIFADPFSTELDIKKFKEILKNVVKMQDILIFFNLQTLKRQKGRKLETDIERLENTIGLSWEEIEKEEDLSEAVKKGIKRNFKDIKSFAVGIAYPIAKKDKLTTMDYFYMVLLTNSYGLIDLFLENYAKIITGNYPILKHQEKLFKIISFPVDKSQSLLELWEKEIDKFLSWKEIVKTGLEKVPTMKNIIMNLNELRRKNFIEFLCDEKYIYRKNGKYGQKGELNPNTIKSKEDLQAIQIKVIH